jgi:hypothetical protein
MNRFQRVIQILDEAIGGSNVNIRGPRSVLAGTDT